MWFLASTAAALASPLGEPVVSPELGRVALSLRGDSEQAWVDDADCLDNKPCSTNWRGTWAGGEAQLNLLPGLGLMGEVGHTSQAIVGAAFAGKGLAYGGGVKASWSFLPMWSLAGNARFTWGSNHNDDAGDSTWQRHSVGAALAWGKGAEGICAWVGGQKALVWRQALSLPVGEGVDMEIVSSVPAQGLVGVALSSRKVGPQWTASPHVVTGLELSLGQVSGGSFWIGATF